VKNVGKSKEGKRNRGYLGYTFLLGGLAEKGFRDPLRINGKGNLSKGTREVKKRSRDNKTGIMNIYKGLTRDFVLIP